MMSSISCPSPVLETLSGLYRPMLLHIQEAQQSLVLADLLGWVTQLRRAQVGSDTLLLIADGARPIPDQYKRDLLSQLLTCGVDTRLLFACASEVETGFTQPSQLAAMLDAKPLCLPENRRALSSTQLPLGKLPLDATADTIAAALAAQLQAPDGAALTFQMLNAPAVKALQSVDGAVLGDLQCRFNEGRLPAPELQRCLEPVFRALLRPLQMRLRQLAAAPALVERHRLRQLGQVRGLLQAASSG